MSPVKKLHAFKSSLKDSMGQTYNAAAVADDDDDDDVVDDDDDVWSTTKLP